MRNAKAARIAKGKLGKYQLKRKHKQATQTHPELTMRKHEDRQAWISKREHKPKNG